MVRGVLSGMSSKGGGNCSSLKVKGSLAYIREGGEASMPPERGMERFGRVWEGIEGVGNHEA